MSRKISAGGASLQNNGVSDVTGLASGAWRTPNADRAVLVLIAATIEPSGVSQALIRFRVDRSGGTTADDIKELRAPAGLGGQLSGEITLWVPPGGSWSFVQVDNPNNNNAIDEINEITL